MAMITLHAPYNKWFREARLYIRNDGLTYIKLTGIDPNLVRELLYAHYLLQCQQWHYSQGMILSWDTIHYENGDARDHRIENLYLVKPIPIRANQTWVQPDVSYQMLETLALCLTSQMTYKVMTERLNVTFEYLQEMIEGYFPDYTIDNPDILEMNRNDIKALIHAQLDPDEIKSRYGDNVGPLISDYTTTTTADWCQESEEEDYYSSAAVDRDFDRLMAEMKEAHEEVHTEHLADLQIASDLDDLHFEE